MRNAAEIKYSLMATMMALSPHVYADEFTMKDGSRVVGQVVEVGNGTVRLQTAFAGIVTIDSGQVVKVTKTAEPTSASSPAVAAAPVTPPVPAVPAAYPPVAVAAPAPTWNGNVNFSAQFGRGSFRSDMMTVQSNLQRLSGPHRVLIAADWTRASSGGILSQSNWTLDPAYRYFTSDHWFYSISGVLMQDKVSYIDAKRSVHPALGYMVYETPSGQLSFELGYGHAWEYTRYGNESSSVLDWRTNFTHHFSNTPIQFFHRNHVFRNMDGRKNLMVTTKTGFSYVLGANLNANWQLNYNYQDQPIADAKKTNSFLMIGLGSNF